MIYNLSTNWTSSVAAENCFVYLSLILRLENGAVTWMFSYTRWHMNFQTATISMLQPSFLFYVFHEIYSCMLDFLLTNVFLQICTCLHAVRLLLQCSSTRERNWNEMTMTTICSHAHCILFPEVASDWWSSWGVIQFRHSCVPLFWSTLRSSSHRFSWISTQWRVRY